MPGTGQEGSGRDRTREIQELEFLVGTACSRTITLLMQPDRDQAKLQDELAFLAARASRLAGLLAEEADGLEEGR